MDDRRDVDDRKVVHLHVVARRHLLVRDVEANVHDDGSVVGRILVPADHDARCCAGRGQVREHVRHTRAGTPGSGSRSRSRARSRSSPRCGRGRNASRRCCRSSSQSLLLVLGDALRPGGAAPGPRRARVRSRRGATATCRGVRRLTARRRGCCGSVRGRSRDRGARAAGATGRAGRTNTSDTRCRDRLVPGAAHRSRRSDAASAATHDRAGRNLRCST